MKEKELNRSKEQNPHLTLMLLHYYNGSSYYKKELYYTNIADYKRNKIEFVCSK